MALSHTLICFLLLLTFICISSSELQPVDVDPILKKEQPDFEDDTGPAAIQIDSKNVKVLTDESSSIPGEIDISFTHAFFAALCIIIVSELGDKTFFIAAIMAMNNSRLPVFAGAMTALAGMHIMSALFGHIITVIPRFYTFYISTALFAIFGIQMLKEGFKMSSDVAKEEFEEVQTKLRHREEIKQKDILEEGQGGVRFSIKNHILRIVSQIFFESLTLTFFAEWGDRSQLATVVLAARENINGVIIGGLIGHFLCTGLAVIGGRIIASRISVKTVTLCGGVTFVIFAVSSLIIGS